MYDKEFHDAIENEEYPQAVRLGEYIKAALPCSKFIDFGCSSGIYVRELIPHVESVGFEFAEDAVKGAVCENIVQCDLTQPIELYKKQGTLGLCLEVLEHIDDEHWLSVLTNITKLCDRVIFSAAVPGQGGVGHINCRPKLDWIRRFHSLGWVVDVDQSRRMRDHMLNGYHMGWFVNNAVIFVPGVL